jgi:ubiquinone/menaquinone biosynthesis C-methylase UbiE
MFDASSHLYDLLYEKGLRKDYAAEVATIVDQLPNARTLLDVACGTGLHLQHLTQHFDCVGTDLDAGMLEVARRRCPDVPLVQADMVDLDLGRSFDAIVCLFSSIGYVQTEERLHAAAASMARHLNRGGTVLVEPWLTPDVWTDGHIGMLTVDEPNVKICRINRSRLEHGCTVMDFHYLVVSADGVERFTEEHTLGLFTWEQYRAAFEAAGLETTIDRTGGPMGRGLIVGRRPS